MLQELKQKSVQDPKWALDYWLLKKKCLIPILKKDKL